MEGKVSECVAGQGGQCFHGVLILAMEDELLTGNRSSTINKMAAAQRLSLLSAVSAAAPQCSVKASGKGPPSSESCRKQILVHMAADDGAAACNCASCVVRHGPFSCARPALRPTHPPPSPPHHQCGCCAHLIQLGSASRGPRASHHAWSCQSCYTVTPGALAPLHHTAVEECFTRT